MFEKLFLILYPYITNSTDMLNAVRQVEDLIYHKHSLAVNQYREQYRVDVDAHSKQVHELLVALCLSNKNIWQPASVQKITAIKALRNLVGFPNASLKQAKEAVEDPRVFAKSQNYHKGWVPDCEQ